VKNPDILHDLSAAKRPDQVVIGFAAETETDEAALRVLGRAKIERKGCDFLVVNSVGWSTGFATEANAIRIVSAAGDIVGEASGSKRAVANRILDVLL
jgi:phosphopantothenoylcysteine decarboxylase/phosphopantothenate--cysteine ligase